MSNGRPILSTRNVILAAIAVLVLSTIASLWKMMRPHDSGGLGRDSFGTKADGFRGLFETLQSLDVPAGRELAPPSDDAPRGQTVLLLEPDPRLVHHGPRYLQALLDWVESGGRLVVVPSNRKFESSVFGVPIVASAPDDILAALEIDEQIELVDPAGDLAYTERDFSQSTGARADEDDVSWRDLWSTRSAEKEPSKTIPISIDDGLASLAPDVRQLSIPDRGVYSLKAAPKDVAGRVSVKVGKDDERVVVAMIRRGQGEIVVISDAALLANRFLAEADNSILATRLLSPDRRPVVFDEFYHGLSVRGNALYLFTRPGFAAIGLAAMLIIGAWMWREAIFLGPPLHDLGAARRGVGEYIDAMAEFFSRGPDSRRFVVREVRDGVLRQLCYQMKLPLHTADVGTIVAAVARRDPPRAQRLKNIVTEVDIVLESPGEYPKSQFMPAVERLSDCL